MREKRESRYAPSRDLVNGVVFSIGGSIYADRGSNYVWVHEFGAYASQQQAYLPPHLAVWEGAGVLMEEAPRKPHEYEIVRVYGSPYPRAVFENSVNFRRAQMSAHGANHQYPTEATIGPDPTLIWAPALQMLKAVGSGTDMTVTVGPLYYGNGASRAYFPTGTASQDVDLTSYIPSSGNRRRVLVYLDTSTGLLAVAAGAEVASNPPWPDTPYGGIASAYFTLTSTHTVIDMTADYTDARRFLDAGGGASSVVPTEAGQMLFANEDYEWTPGFLVMDPDTDEIVLDEDTGDLVWGN
jgi:hypothetical protein